MNYPIDELDIVTLTEQWVNWLVTHFRRSDDVNQCNADLLEFVEMLSSICEYRDMHEAWVFCDNDEEFMINWPPLVSLWQAIFVIPTRTVICEPSFPKQNRVKSEKITRLNLDTVDHLMRVSLNGFGVEFMDWNGMNC